MSLEKRYLEGYTIPEDKFRDYWSHDYCDDWILSPQYELVKAELTKTGVEFVFFFCTSEQKKLHKEPLCKLADRIEAIVARLIEKVNKGEITLNQFFELNKQAMSDNHISDLKAFTLDEEHIFQMIRKMRFPSFWSSFHKLEYAMPNQRISAVRLTKGNIEFTIEDLRIP